MSFKKEVLTDWERRNLKEIYSFKGGWRTLGLLALFCIVGPFVFPLIPPRYGSNWTAPNGEREYYERINFLWLPVLLIIVFAFIATRLAADLLLGYKRSGDFLVTKVLTIWTIKILILDDWRIFYIKKNEAYFDKASIGQRIQIKRTGTHRLIDYNVYEREASA
jgi:hypothetical protein